MITKMRPTNLIRIWLFVGICTLAIALLLPAVGFSPTEDNVKHAMTLLKAEAAKLGAPNIKGEDPVVGKTVPALFFGTTKMNNNSALVEAVQNATGARATFFVKSGTEFIRVATTVKKPDGSSVIGTALDPKGKPFAAVSTGQPYSGEADIFGKAYLTDYEPIRDAANNVIGIYFVGYPK